MTVTADAISAIPGVKRELERLIDRTERGEISYRQWGELADLYNAMLARAAEAVSEEHARPRPQRRTRERFREVLADYKRDRDAILARDQQRGELFIVGGKGGTWRPR